MYKVFVVNFFRFYQISFVHIDVAMWDLRQDMETVIFHVNS